MGFYGDSSSLLGLINSRRCVAIQGHYGSGKTALAFRLAIEMIERYGYKHIVSNCDSVITDDYNSIELDENGHLNAVVILDEAGESITKMSDTKGWLAFPRKLNICLLLATWDSLPSNVTKVELSRVENYESLGFSMWVYGISLDGGKTKDDKFKVTWRNPAEIFGVYDTDGFGGGSDEILEWLKTRTSQAAQKRGYVSTAQKYVTQRSLFDRDVHGQISGMEDIGGQADDKQSIQATESSAVSVLQPESQVRQNSFFTSALHRLNSLARRNRRSAVDGRALRGE